MENAEHKEDLSLRIGSSLKRLRQERGWTIKRLADAAGLSSPFLSRVERGLTIPSIPTLQGLADTLKVDIESFFAKDEHRRYVISRKGSRRREVALRGREQKIAYELELLADEMESPLMEPALITVNADPDQLTTNSHGGQEFVYVLEGEIGITLGARTFVLKEGDAAYWDGGLPHGAVNTGPNRARTLNVHLVPGKRTDSFQINRKFPPAGSDED